MRKEEIALIPKIIQKQLDDLGTYYANQRISIDQFKEKAVEVYKNYELENKTLESQGDLSLKLLLQQYLNEKDAKRKDHMLTCMSDSIKKAFRSELETILNVYRKEYYLKGLDLFFIHEERRSGRFEISDNDYVVLETEHQSKKLEFQKLLKDYEALAQEKRKYSTEEDETAFSKRKK